MGPGFSSLLGLHPAHIRYMKGILAIVGDTHMHAHTDRQTDTRLGKIISCTVLFAVDVFKLPSFFFQ